MDEFLVIGPIAIAVGVLVILGREAVARFSERGGVLPTTQTHREHVVFVVMLAGLLVAFGLIVTTTSLIALGSD